MRLVDADAIKAEIQKICDNCWHPYRLGGCPEHCGINDAVKAIDSAQTVNAIDAVRCRDCIRYRPDDEVWGRCTVMPYRMRKNDYCSYGVIDDMRKDGDA